MRVGGVGLPPLFFCSLWCFVFCCIYFFIIIYLNEHACLRACARIGCLRCGLARTHGDGRATPALGGRPGRCSPRCVCVPPCVRPLPPALPCLFKRRVGGMGAGRGSPMPAAGAAEPLARPPRRCARGAQLCSAASRGCRALLQPTRTGRPRHIERGAIPGSTSPPLPGDSPGGGGCLRRARRGVQLPASPSRQTWESASPST